MCVKRSKERQMERESGEAETEMKKISTAIIKDYSCIIAELFSAQSNSCSENPTAASPSVSLCAAVCAYDAQGGR